ncbi:MAG TPA: hypothetical protein VNE58_08920 [Casimicrobiaceae bacterium]|nr:hypothetical protein [Casimicrobiaceae bacterium]
MVSRRIEAWQRAGLPLAQPHQAYAGAPVTLLGQQLLDVVTSYGQPSPPYTPLNSVIPTVRHPAATSKPTPAPSRDRIR